MPYTNGISEAGGGKSRKNKTEIRERNNGTIIHQSNKSNAYISANTTKLPMNTRLRQMQKKQPTNNNHIHRQQ